MLVGLEMARNARFIEHAAFETSAGVTISCRLLVELLIISKYM